MEIIRLNDSGLAMVANKAAEVIRTGGIVLYPTDTLYGLGADAFSDEAVAKIYSIKGRKGRKPIHAIVADTAMAEEYAEIPEDARMLADRAPKGKITFICKKRSGFDSGIVRAIDTFGFRIPDNMFCIEMIRAFGKPITATSANKSNEEPHRSIEKVLEQLGDDVQYVDLVIDAGELPATLPSSVVDLSGLEPVILREGAVPRERIREILEC